MRRIHKAFVAAPLLLSPIMSMASAGTPQVVPAAHVTARWLDLHWPVIEHRDVIQLNGRVGLGMNSAEELAQRIPVLQFSAPSTRLTSFSIRGLGSSSFNDGLESNVGLWVDGVQLGRQGMFPADLGGFERVEVLRGPQGTLYGRNSSAGVVHLVSPTPAWQPTGRVEAWLGNDQLRHYRAELAGPLVDQVLAASLSVYQRGADGDLRNSFSGRRLNDEDRQGYRGQLLWRGAGDLSARLILEQARQNENCCAYPVMRYSASARSSAAFVGYSLPPTRPFDRRVDQDSRNRTTADQNAATLHIEAPLSEQHRLTYIAGWRTWALAARSDLDGLGLPISPAGGVDLDHEQFSHELRLSGALNAHLDYLAGVHWMRQTLDRRGWLQYGAAAADWFAGSVPLVRQLGLTPMMIDDGILAGARVESPGSQTARSQALYGQLDWRVAEPWLLSAGLRLADERKDGEARRSAVRPALGADPVSQMVGPALQAATLGQDYQRRDSVNDHLVGGHLRATHYLPDDVTIYLSASSSYKAGGLNAEPVGAGVSPTFDPERAFTLELGGSLGFARGRGSAQLALYQTQVRDYQAITYNPLSSALNPQRNNLMNVGRVRSRGAELDAHLQFTPAMSGYIGLAWNDSRYQKFDNAPCPPGSPTLFCDQKGKQLFGAPRWTLSTGIDTRQRLAPQIDWLAGLGYYWRDGAFGTLERGEGTYLASRGLADAYLGLGDRQEHWDLSLVVRNLFDRRYVAAYYALTGTGDYGAAVADERSVALRLRAGF